MSAAREVRLWCDHRDEPAEGKRFGHHCTEEFHADPNLGFVSSVTVMRREAAKAGWTHVRSPLTGRRTSFDEDFCPAHKPAGSPNSAEEET
jgi:hypothetical protein